MQKSISLGSGFNPRRAMVPAAISLVVAGAAGVYALRNEPGDAMPPRPIALQPASLAVSYQPAASLNASFAEIAPPQAVQALQQVAQVRTDPAPFARSFAQAFKPMTAPTARREPVVALAQASDASAEPAPPVAPAPAVAPVAAIEPPASGPEPAPAAVAMPEAVAPPVESAAPVSEAARAVEQAPVAAEPMPQAVVQADPVPEPVADPVELPVPEQATAEPAAPVAPSPPALAMAVVPALPVAAAPVAVTAPQAEPQAAPPVAMVGRTGTIADAGVGQGTVERLVPAPAPIIAKVTAAPQPSAKAPLVAARPALSAAQSRAAPRKPVKALAGPQIPSRYRLVEGGVETSIGVQMYGERLGAVPLRVLGNGVPSLQLGDLLGLIRTRLAPGQYERLSASAAAEEYVSLEVLRKAGIPVRYDAARDELKLGEE